ncbi:trypsin-like peptidase domain-containing protein [Achromobacter sp. 2789STDY5608621]|uniref:trypsin-like peptidase domain-containing protein n=1 Tax=Achromobacter sp. 2789STDY5608621 TaxID=1806496 RepID=UPI0006C357EA|nr:trypsin-like peptidase domain-containing protein [Achromobacter sp. 2789STDY5608621]CUI84843.1 Uncharacterised protein [Achromobacter sp. 2789STDY5608621]
MTSFNLLSQASYFVSSRFNEVELSTATAFFVLRKSKMYLITNWHVVSGRNPETGKCLSDTCALPNNLLVRVHKNSEHIEFSDFEIPLFDGSCNKLWLEHPSFKERVDVVALEVCIPNHLSVFDIENFIEPFNEDTEEAVATDVFVIGYPFGRSVEGIFPIWKRASVASEPCIDVDGLPKILVDTASRSGMSGSPVMLYEKRAIGVCDGVPGQPGARLSNFLMKLVGVYSGRIGVDDENIKAQLGVVWKSVVIDEIISHKDAQSYDE